MSTTDLNIKTQATILIVDDVLDNLAVLHDALDESGYTVLVASHGQTALSIAKDAQPSLILLDAMMPEMDGFEVCRKLKNAVITSHIPVIFMTGLTEAEHVAAAFEAGGIDYVTKPIRPKEVLARIAAHMRTAQQISQTISTLDAFGQAAIAVTPEDCKIVWQTPLARQWMQNYYPEASVAETTPIEVMKWLEQIQSKALAPASPLIATNQTGRLTLSLSDDTNYEHWVILLREESDAAHIDALIQAFSLTKREAEVLYWTIKGKTNKDIGDILGSSPRTVNKHLEHVFVKLGVETRTAAASLAASRLRL